MKIGFSSFNFVHALRQGRTSMPEVIDWIANHDGEHLELATITFSPPERGVTWNMDDDVDLLDSIKRASRDHALEISGLCMPADFLSSSAEARQRQIERVKHHVRLCDDLGIRFLRHDVVDWKYANRDLAAFESDLPALVEGCKEVAQYAAGYGITTSVENHGFYMNASERVRRLIFEVDEANFGTTLDVGNFLCVNEDPLVATEVNLPYATFVHLKDFYIRDRTWPLGEEWLTTPGGTHLMGSIIGYGDMPMASIVSSLVRSGYDGFVSIEFEGIEDSLLGCARGMANTKALLQLARARETINA